jgi:hypothetical protein
MVAELIESGCAPEVAAAVVARAFVAGASSTGFRGIPVDETAEKRRAYDRERKRKSTGIPPESTGIPVSPIDTKIKNSKRQNSDRPSRGTRIDPDWSPTAAEREFAIAEGLATAEINREAARFRDYWKGRAGSGGVKLDWSATWQNWIRSTAEKLGRSPRSSTTGGQAPGFYAKFGSEEQDAWDRYGQAKSGKSFPRDKDGGWRHPTQWPPGYTPQATTEAISVPRLKSA